MLLIAVESSGIKSQSRVSLSVCRRTRGLGWAVATRGLAWSVAVSEPPQPPGLICDKKNYACGIDDDDGDGYISYVHTW